MNTRKYTAEYRLKKWAAIIKECRESGLSVKAYCANTGFHPNTYFYWQKKLREAAYEIYAVTQTVSTALNPLKNTAIDNKNLLSAADECHVPAGWLSVGPKNREAAVYPEAPNITIRRSDWIITLGPGCDAELLAETLKAVNRICC